MRQAKRCKSQSAPSNLLTRPTWAKNISSILRAFPAHRWQTVEAVLATTTGQRPPRRQLPKSQFLLNHSQIFLPSLFQQAGGEGGIRTPVRLSPEAVFKTAAIDHSATSPLADWL